LLKIALIIVTKTFTRILKMGHSVATRRSRWAFLT
jgi:hypothetical protein